jgi:SAM-dependent methyltransferase
MDGEVVRSQAFLDRFLAGRAGRTRSAYQVDIEDFARYAEETPASAVAKLLGGGPDAGRRMVLDYAVELLGAGRASATVARRLGTLRTLVREAHRTGLVTSPAAIPTEHEARAEAAERVTMARYLLPRHPAEIDRLDVQHYALLEALGTNHLAPVEAPRRILDAGCGSGQWGFDLCAEFPEARVVGIDLVPGKDRRPRRYSFVKANLLSGLPFRDARFDYVHQRFLVAGMPLATWPSEVAELARIAAPGGWVELVECSMGLDPAGPATVRVRDLMMGLAGSLGLDTGQVVHDSIDTYLREAGLVDVHRHELSLPVGDWGGRIGQLMATDARAGLTRACEVLHAHSRLSPEEGVDLIQTASAELEQYQSALACVVAIGRKPA